MIVQARDGTPIFLRVSGPQGAAAVVLLHGYPLDGSMWDHAAGALAARARCVIPDLRGLGRTPPGPEGTWPRGVEPHLAVYAQDTLDVLDGLGLREPVVAVGLSMGGMICWELLRLAPGRIRGVVICDSRVGAETPEGLVLRRERAQRARRDGAAGVAHIAEQMIGPLLAPDADPDVRSGVLSIMRASDPEGVAAGQEALASRPDATPIITSLRRPAHFICGELDAISSPESHERMRALVPAALGPTLCIIPGAGHVPPLECPEAFADALGAALERIYAHSGE